MTVTPAQLRTNFPEFADTAAYPDSMLTFWLSTAYLLLPANRWRSVLDLGAQLFTAHNASLEYQAQARAAAGAPPGMDTGSISSQSASKVAMGFDTSTGIDASAGHWKLTTFGLRFLELMRIAGAGGIYVAPCNAQPLFNGPGWNGPFTGFN